VKHSIATLVPAWPAGLAEMSLAAGSQVLGLRRARRPLVVLATSPAMAPWKQMQSLQRRNREITLRQKPGCGDRFRNPSLERANSISATFSETTASGAAAQRGIRRRNPPQARGAN